MEDQISKHVREGIHWPYFISSFYIYVQMFTHIHTHTKKNPVKGRLVTPEDNKTADISQITGINQTDNYRHPQ